MLAIQYSARSARLSMHKLVTSCIRRCLVPRACDWVMSALSAVLRIYSFQFRLSFIPCRSARQHSGLLGLPNIGHWSEWPKTWGGFLYGAYRPGNDFELIPTVKMKTRHHLDGSFGSEFPSIYNQRAWSYGRLKSQNIKNVWEIFAFFGKTISCGKIFNILFQSFSLPHRSTCCVQLFRVTWGQEFWGVVRPTEKHWESRLRCTQQKRSFIQSSITAWQPTSTLLTSGLHASHCIVPVKNPPLRCGLFVKILWPLVSFQLLFKQTILQLLSGRKFIKIKRY